MSATASEEWRPVPGWPPYEVSSLGRVRRGIRFLQCHPNDAGYVRVKLRSRGRVRSIYVHQLVAWAFLPKPRGARLVRHLNHDRADNRLDNLAWGTGRDNYLDDVRANRQRIRLNAEIVRNIRLLADKGIKASTISEVLHIGKRTVTSVLSRKTWGYIE